MSANSQPLLPVCDQKGALHSVLSFFVLFFLAKGEADVDFDDEIGSRTHFPDSWLWMDNKLPDCPTGQPHW